jgi:hypothetical protein
VLVLNGRCDDTASIRNKIRYAYYAILVQAALCVGCHRDIRTLKNKPSLYGFDVIQVDKICACGRNENLAIDPNDAFSASFLGPFAIDDTASLCFEGPEFCDVEPFWVRDRSFAISGSNEGCPFSAKNLAAFCPTDQPPSSGPV